MAVWRQDALLGCMPVPRMKMPGHTPTRLLVPTIAYHIIPELSLPTFSSTTQNAGEFLKDMDDYFQCRNMMDSKPIVGHSRPVQFSARVEVRSQLQEKLRDEVLEMSDSPLINPLTIVYKENKQPRICLDARKINRILVMVPNSKSPPVGRDFSCSMVQGTWPVSTYHLLLYKSH
jgi:hypothetical protein